MPKQVLELRDYFGALAVWCIFFTFLFIVSVTVLNFCCVTKKDDTTVVEKWGYRQKLHTKLGPHRVSVVARAVQEEEFRADLIHEHH